MRMGSERVRTTSQSVRFNCVRTQICGCYRRGAGGSKSMSGCKKCELELMNVK